MLSREIERRIAEAIDMAKRKRQEFVTSEHVLYCLSHGGGTSEILRSLGVDMPRLRKRLLQYIEENIPSASPETIEEQGGFERWRPEISIAIHRWIQRAYIQVRNAGKEKVTEGHFLVALFFETDSFAVHALEQEGITQFDLMTAISHHEALPSSGTGAKTNQESATGDTSEESSTRSILDQLGTNLNEKAKTGKLDPLVGRKDLIRRISQVLGRYKKNNPLLVGDPGVGKTALVEGLALLITDQKAPSFLQDKIIYSLDTGSLVAGTKFRGDFEGRLKQIIEEVRHRPEVILFIDEIHTIIGAGSSGTGSLDAANILKPALNNGDIRVIGSTTFEEYRKFFEKDAALNRRFQKIDVKEPSYEETLEILKGVRKKLESFHQVSFTEEALAASIELSQKYIHGKMLPDKAIDLLDEAGSTFKLEQKNGSISSEELSRIVAQMAGINLGVISTSELDRLKTLEGRLKAVVFAQDEAIEKVVAAIKYVKSGLAPETKPIGSFLFVGPTGVGKTEVSKQLAEHLGVPFIRFDMSEYMEKHSISRLIGAPPGYVGYEEGGQLTEAVRKSPHSVVLLDEIEKAHPDIFNALLQVMDAGRLTDAQGRTTDFRHVLLIMTSNAGALELSRGRIGLSNDLRDVTGITQEALKRTFTPEFLNRLTSIIFFQALGKTELAQVMEKLLHELQTRLLKKEVYLTYSKEVVEYLVNKGYQPEYGARPLARTLDELVKRPMVDELLFGRLRLGGRVDLRLDGDRLVFEYLPLNNLLPITQKS